MRASVLIKWRQARPPQRFAYLVGGALILVGLGHLAARLAIGGAWQGLVSFRGPTTFGISSGLTTITLAWITGHLRITDPSRRLLLGPLAVADIYGVAWVAVQRWRSSAPAALGFGLSRGVALGPRGWFLSWKLVREAETLEERGHHEGGHPLHPGALQREHLQRLRHVAALVG